MKGTTGLPIVDELHHLSTKQLKRGEGWFVATSWSRETNAVTAITAFSKEEIRLVHFTMNFFKFTRLTCHSFRSMYQTGQTKGYFSVLDRQTWRQLNGYGVRAMSFLAEGKLRRELRTLDADSQNNIEPLLGKLKPLVGKNNPHLGKQKPLVGKNKLAIFMASGTRDFQHHQ